MYFLNMKFFVQWFEIIISTNHNFFLQDNKIFDIITFVRLHTQITYPLFLSSLSNVRSKLNEEFKLSS